MHRVVLARIGRAEAAFTDPDWGGGGRSTTSTPSGEAIKITHSHCHQTRSKAAEIYGLGHIEKLTTMVFPLQGIAEIF